MRVKILLCLVVLGYMTSQGVGDVAAATIVSSAMKMKEFIGSEKKLLEGLQKFISYQEERQEALMKSSGYEDDLETIKKVLGPIKELEEEARQNVSQATGAGNSSHPTASYLAVKHFLSRWMDKLKDNSTWRGSLILEMAGLQKVKFPTPADLDFARNVLLRLQLVYNLSASDVMQGRVLGNQGPPLSPADAYDLGVAALRANLPDFARDWLELAVERETGSNASFPVHHAHVLLASIYHWEEDYERVSEAITKAMKSRDTDIRQEAVRIRAGKGTPLVDATETLPSWWSNFTQLCAGPPEKTGLRRVDVCRLRHGRVPYQRYREEVLSARPYVAILYDVMTERDVSGLRDSVIPEFGMAPVSNEPDMDRLRVGEVLYQDNNATARVLNKLGDALGLFMMYPNTTDPLLVVHYPLGGEMYPHVDYHPRLDFDVMEGAGDRLVSLQVFMNEVEAGGAEVFPEIGVRVQPRKGAVLFWYNYSPLGELETKTVHASCPVAVGEKLEADVHVRMRGNVGRLVSGRRRRHSHFTVDRLLFLNRVVTRATTEYEYYEEE